MRRSGEVLFVACAAGQRPFVAGRPAETMDAVCCAQLVVLDEQADDLPWLLARHATFVSTLQRDIGDGTAYLAGGFQRIPGMPAAGPVLRFDADGCLDRGWRWRGLDAMAPHALAGAAQSEWLYLAADHFSAGLLQHHQPLSRARQDNGRADPYWRPVFSAVAAQVYVFCLLAHGRHLYVAGHFSAIDGVARCGIARFHLDSGTLDPDWAPAVDGWWVSTLAVAGDWLYLGGEFSAVDGLPRNNLARVSLAHGHVDRHWVPQAADGGWESVEALALHPPSDDLFVGRRMHSSRVRRQGLLRLSTVDGQRRPLDGLLPEGDVTALLADAAGERLLVAGHFRGSGGMPGGFALMTLGLPRQPPRAAVPRGLATAGAARRGSGRCS